MLTNEEKILVEENYKLIYKYTNEHNLDLEEYSGLLSIGLCNAAMIYNIEKSEFSTLAYKCMRNEVSNYRRKMRTAKYMKDEYVSSYDALVDDCGDGDKLKDAKLVSLENIETDYIFRIKFQKEYNKLKDKAKRIIYLRYLGHTNNEVAEIMGMKASTVSMAVKKFRMALA